MPCDTIRTIEVDAGKMQKEQFIEAMKRLGYAPYSIGQGDLVMFNGGNYNVKTGKMSLTNTTIDMAQVKKAYSAAIVESQAKKYGWQIKKTGEYQYQVTKR